MNNIIMNADQQEWPEVSHDNIVTIFICRGRTLVGQQYDFNLSTLCLVDNLKTGNHVA